jgi:hypothetical protein
LKRNPTIIAEEMALATVVSDKADFLVLQTNNRSVEVRLLLRTNRTRNLHPGRISRVISNGLKLEVNSGGRVHYIGKARITGRVVDEQPRINKNASAGGFGRCGLWTALGN